MKIAIQKKGHLRDESILFLNSLGITCLQNKNQLITKCPKTNIEIVFLRDDDIPNYVNNNLIDFGIIGEDVISENNNQTKVVKKLGFSKCQLVMASPKDSKIKNINNLQNKTIATSYPNILKKFLKQNKIQSTIITVSGSVEVAPRLNLSDAVCDLTQTGNTLRECGLKQFATVFKSEAVLIQSQSKNQEKQNFLDLIKQYANS
ncbi:MAG: ATP phosphoribosyltransferase [Candidatus Magasanikiibacteriota bacterium]